MLMKIFDQYKAADARALRAGPAGDNRRARSRAPTGPAGTLWANIPSPSWKIRAAAAGLPAGAPHYPSDVGRLLKWRPANCLKQKQCLRGLLP
jgi:hypothetical protein